MNPAVHKEIKSLCNLQVHSRSLGFGERRSFVDIYIQRELAKFLRTCKGQEACAGTDQNLGQRSLQGVISITICQERM